MPDYAIDRRKCEARLRLAKHKARKSTDRKIEAIRDVRQLIDDEGASLALAQVILKLIK